MTPRELLIDTLAYIPPSRAIEALTPQDAERRVSTATHSIAEIVAHLIFWQTWFTRRIEGVAEPMVTSAALGWPAVSPGSWDDLHAQFLGGLERIAALGGSVDRLDARIDPAIEFPLLAEHT